MIIEMDGNFTLPLYIIVITHLFQYFFEFGRLVWSESLCQRWNKRRHKRVIFLPHRLSRKYDVRVSNAVYIRLSSFRVSPICSDYAYFFACCRCNRNMYEGKTLPASLTCCSERCPYQQLRSSSIWNWDKLCH